MAIPLPPPPTSLSSPCGTWTAWIETDTKLEVHSVQLLDDKVVEGWVVSEPGAEYTIHVKCERKAGAHPDTAVYAYVDGANVAGKITHFSRKGAGREETLSMRGRRSAENEEQALIFSLLQRAEGGQVLDEAATRKLGMIEVQVNNGLTGNIIETRGAYTVQDLEALDEKTKKGLLDTTTRFGPKKVVQSTTRNFEDAPGQGRHNPAFTFRFHYRGRGLLMAMEKLPNPNKRQQSPPCNNKNSKNKRKVIELHSTDSEPEAEAEAGPSKLGGRGVRKPRGRGVMAKRGSMAAKRGGRGARPTSSSGSASGSGIGSKKGSPDKKKRKLSEKERLREQANALLAQADSLPDSGDEEDQDGSGSDSDDIKPIVVKKKPMPVIELTDSE